MMTGNRRALVALAVILGAIAGCSVAAITPKAYDDLYDQGLSHMRRENYAAARSTFQDLLKRFPDQVLNQDAELLLADCEYRLGNTARAKSIRERIAREATSTEIKVRALYGLGMMEIAAEDFAPAAGRFHAAALAETDPARRGRILFRRGVALQRAGRFAEARQVYQEAAAAVPNSKVAQACEEQLAYPDHFSVQTGAFIHAGEAEKMRDLLAKKGFKAETLLAGTSRGKFNCVRVGRFADRAAAKAEAERIRAAKVLPEGTRLAIRP